MKGDIYHIINRGVEKRDIFLDDEDFFRFRDDLKDFNNKNRVPMSHYDRHKFNKFNLELQVPSDELVEILCVCLMPNHYHLLVREKVDGGVKLFMNKLGVGYTHFFNQKYKRIGVLFQGRAKKILVEKDAHFIHLPYYILANPIKLIQPKWKDEGIKDKKKAIKFLDNYKWVSFRDIVSGEGGIFSEVINRGLFLKVFDFGTARQFKLDFDEWIESFEL